MKSNKQSDIIPKQQIDCLCREFKQLVNGEYLEIELPKVQLNSFNIAVRWLTGMESEVDYLRHSNDDYQISKSEYKKIEEIVDEEINKAKVKLNLKIQQFCKKVENLEIKYNLPKDRVWEDYLWKIETR